MGQVENGLWQEESDSLSSIQIQGKTRPVCTLEIGASIKLIVFLREVINFT